MPDQDGNITYEIYGQHILYGDDTTHFAPECYENKEYIETVDIANNEIVNKNRYTAPYQYSRNIKAVNFVGKNKSAELILTPKNPYKTESSAGAGDWVPFDDQVLIYSSCNNIKFESVKLSDSRQIRDLQNWQGVYINFQSGYDKNFKALTLESITFEDCTFENGIALWNFKNTKIENCIFENAQKNRYGVWFGNTWDSTYTSQFLCETVSVRNCTFNGSRGIKLDGSREFTYNISDNVYNITEAGYELKNYNSNSKSAN